jgi:hypothetical protein
MATDADIQALIILEVGDEVTTAWPLGVLTPISPRCGHRSPIRHK